VVNPDETVILVGLLGEVTLLFGFHPQPGNYTTYLAPGCDLRNSDRWEFYCPICRANLRADEHENLCELMIWQGDAMRKILFSRVVGERATYVVMDAATISVEEAHGEHAKNYEHTLPRFNLEEFEAYRRAKNKQED